LTQAEAIFAYHDDYKNLLFTLNIDESKREEFLKDNIDEELYFLISTVKFENISQIIDILKQLQNDEKYELKAKKSIQNLYKSIQNPDKNYLNKEKIYRV